MRCAALRCAGRCPPPPRPANAAIIHCLWDSNPRPLAREAGSVPLCQSHRWGRSRVCAFCIYLLWLCDSLSHMRPPPRDRGRAGGRYARRAARRPRRAARDCAR
eukprot:7086357-Prymnesium_polylepis.1